MEAVPPEVAEGCAEAERGAQVQYQSTAENASDWGDGEGHCDEIKSAARLIDVPLYRKEGLWGKKRPSRRGGWTGE